MGSLDLIAADPYLEPHKSSIEFRIGSFLDTEKRIAPDGILSAFASAHLYYGRHKKGKNTVIREWAPNAEEIYLIGNFSEWMAQEDFRFTRVNDRGDWEITVDSSLLPHETLYKYFIKWPGGMGDRISPYARRVVQDPDTHIFSAQVWDPDNKYRWKNPTLKNKKLSLSKDLKSHEENPLIIYEAHIGMGTEKYESRQFC